jgi:hypothetical protein
MALYSLPESPGVWANFLKRADIKTLPLTEQRKKYITEQLQFDDFVATQMINKQVTLHNLNNQHTQGGYTLNGVTNVDFVASPTFQTITGNVQTMTVKFKKPVVVTGNPTIPVVNDQAGNGAAETFDYVYSAGSKTDTLTFSYTQPAEVNNDGDFAGNVLTLDADLVADGGTLVQPATAIIGVYPDVIYTTDGNGVDASLEVEVDVNGDIISIVVTTEGTLFKPNDIITFEDDELGLGSVGGSVVVTAASLTVDTVSLASNTSIALAGGTITTGDGTWNPQLQDTARRQGTPALDFTSSSTKTGVVS